MKTAFALATLLALSMTLPGFAAEPYAPDVIELDGSDSSRGPARHEQGDPKRECDGFHCHASQSNAIVG